MTLLSGTLWLLISAKGAVTGGIGALRLWRSGPAPGSGRAKHAALLGCMALLTIFAAPMALAALHSLFGG